MIIEKEAANANLLRGKRSMWSQHYGGLAGFAIYTPEWVVYAFFYFVMHFCYAYSGKYDKYKIYLKKNKKLILKVANKDLKNVKRPYF